MLNVKGLKAGASSLKVASGNLFSSIRPIQVFEPLRLSPRNLSLLLGSTYQVEAKGGPMTDCSIDFLSDDESIAYVSHGGLVTAKALGVTLIKAVSLHSGTDQLPVSEVKRINA